MSNLTRRGFFQAMLGTAGGLVLPHEPERVYSFGENVGRAYTTTLQIMGLEVGDQLAIFREEDLLRYEATGELPEAIINERALAKCIERKVVHYTADERIIARVRRGPPRPIIPFEVRQSIREPNVYALRVEDEVYV